MNLTDLTDELQAQAANATPTAGLDRLTGVRHRIRVRRRRQVASAAGLTALGVAAIVLGPSLSGLRADRAERTPPPAQRTTADPLTFAPTVDGDPLVVSGVGTAGQTELVLRFTPTNNNLAVSKFCRLPGAGPEAVSGLVTVTTVNGKPMSEGGCSGDAAANQNMMSRGSTDTVNRAGWARFGVIPGRESVIRVRVTAAKAGTEIPAGVRLGVGVYELTGPRVTEGEVTFQLVRDAAGHSYHLADYGVAEVVNMVDGKASTAVHHMYMDVPAGRHPVQVWLGLLQTEAERKTGGFTQLYVDGKPTGIRNSAGGTGLEQLDDAKAHTIELRVEPAAARGTMVLAYYVRND
jgi:hypothetical protein